MLIRILLLYVCLLNTAHAEIFKCVINGNTVFSDEPCADNAEQLKLNVYQPKAEDISKKHETTARYQQDSKVNEIQTLQQTNENLQNQIQQLKQQANTELQALKAKTYRYSDTQVAATEHGVFEQMNAVMTNYQVKIEDVRARIVQNEQRIEALKFSLRTN